MDGYAADSHSTRSIATPFATRPELVLAAGSRNTRTVVFVLVKDTMAHRRPTRILLAVSFCLATAAYPAVAQPKAGPPERTVDGRVLTSRHSPAVQIRVPEPFTYAGGQRFILYEVADAEQHLFVEADERQRARRLYWVQFEGYLPDNEHQYDYKGDIVEMGGLSWIANSAARQTDASPRPGSDGAYAREMLGARGYTLPVQVLWQRLVHLTDDTRRRELMIIYLEDLSATGLTAADLAEGGAAHDRWPAFAADLLRRATAGLELRRHADAP